MREYDKKIKLINIFKFKFIINFKKSKQNIQKKV